MNIAIAVSAVVILFCILLNKLSSKLGVPVLLAFIVLGMIFGTDGLLKIPFDDYGFAEKICSTALIFIMFYGGFGTNWKAAKPVAVKSILLSTLGVIMTAGITAAFCILALGMPAAEGFLIGTLLGSTDAASVFSILRSKRLNLKYNTASLLEVESGSNDPSAYMLTIIVISLMKGTANGTNIAYMIFSQLAYGIAAGIIIAALGTFILKHVKFTTVGFDTIFVVALALLSYALPALIGGNGYLSTYIVGIVLGNIKVHNKKTLVPFFDGINGLMQMLIFFLLGLLSTPSNLISIWPTALLIALFMTFAARPITVMAILSPFKSKLPQQIVTSWCGLRGAASIVFAITATTSVKSENDIFHIVFCVVLFSILIQGSLLPLISRKLGMIDDTDDVMKTFTDYSDEVPVQFVRFTIPDGHDWCEKAIKEITLPPDTILALLIRGERRIAPVGNTKLHVGDTLVLTAKSSGNIDGVNLSERVISHGDELIGKSLEETKKPDDALIIMIKRGKAVIIPHGSTKIRENDVLVINHYETDI